MFTVFFNGTSQEGGPSQHYGQQGVLRVGQKKINEKSSVVRNYMGVCKTAILAPLNALKIDTMPSKLGETIKIIKKDLKFSILAHILTN